MTWSSLEEKAMDEIIKEFVRTVTDLVTELFLWKNNYGFSYMKLEGGGVSYLISLSFG